MATFRGFNPMMTYQRRSVLRFRLRPVRPAVIAVLLLGLWIGTGTVQTTSTVQPRHQVYLLRGFMNVFSLGMDEIAAKLHQQGIYATVHNHLAWSELADEAAAALNLHWQISSGKVSLPIESGAE